MRQLAQNLSLSALALLLCVGVGEVALRVLHFDRQLEYDVDKELYWSFRPNQSGFLWMGNGTFRSPDTRINNLGLRGSDVAAEASDRVRILTLGDSYAFGSGVADGDTFSAVLQHALGPEVEVINAGVPGYGVFQAERMLSKLGPLLRPQIVIIAIPTGDVFRQPFSDPAEELAYLEGQRRRKRLRRVSQFVTYMYRQYSLLKSRWDGSEGALPPQTTSSKPAEFAALWQRDAARLASMADLCQQLGAYLVVMAWTQEWDGRTNGVLIEGIRGLGTRKRNLIALVDLERSLGAYPRPQLVIAGDGHPSATAHNVAGLYLAEEVRRLLDDASSHRVPGPDAKKRSTLMTGSMRGASTTIRRCPPSNGRAATISSSSPFRSPPRSWAGRARW